MRVDLQVLQAEIAALFVSGEEAARAIPIHLLHTDRQWPQLPPAADAWLSATGYRAREGLWSIIPGEGGTLAGVVLGVAPADPDATPLRLGVLPTVLPPGLYALAGDVPDAAQAALAWALGAYEFRAYMTRPAQPPRRLVWPAGVDRDRLLAEAAAVWHARHLINTPASDLGPAQLHEAAAQIARAHGASVTLTEGAPLADGFPLIAAVGRASDRPPCLIDMRLPRRNAPKVVLVGKGVCFDTGGLNIKPGLSMALMKKDMAGAATALAIAHMVMSAGLPVDLRVLIPAADNNIAANAFRPGDILTSRSGQTVEISNTDAEGRLLLADALALADEEAPQLVMTFATLTGAARVALGPELPALFSDDAAAAGALVAQGAPIDDPLWRLPLWPRYREYLKSKVADVDHAADTPFAGAITAALFLQRFVTRAECWVHLDLYGWMPRALPGRPPGGEPQGARAVFRWLETRYGGA